MMSCFGVMSLVNVITFVMYASVVITLGHYARVRGYIDSEHSTVTYTSVSEDDSDIGSPGVDGPPIMPEDPYAYIMADLWGSTVA
ncbi:hypothetical protein Tco_0745515 [Tanacetum coccineum]